MIGMTRLHCQRYAAATGPRSAPHLSNGGITAARRRRSCSLGRPTGRSHSLGLLTAVPVVLVMLLGGAGTTLAGSANGRLLEALRHGGHVIYLRHAPTDWSQHDQVRGQADFASCDPKRMRQLSDAGRALARRLGRTIRRLNIPIGRVVASEYCRTAETARLLDLGEVETTRDLINARVADFVGGREALARTARARLAAPPPSGTNTLIVGHGNVFLLAVGTRPPEAGAAIVRNDGPGGITLIEVVGPDDWARLGSLGGDPTNRDEP